MTTGRINQVAVLTRHREAKSNQQAHGPPVFIPSPHHRQAPKQISGHILQPKTPFQDAFCGFTHSKIHWTTYLLARAKSKCPRNSVLRPIRTCTGSRPTRSLKQARIRTYSDSAQDPPSKIQPLTHQNPGNTAGLCPCLLGNDTKLCCTNVLLLF